MSSVCLIDTSIFLNLLDVPYCNEARAAVAEDFATFVEAGCSFLLPMATILETGNHIAQNGDGNLRRKTAQRFVFAVNGSAVCLCREGCLFWRSPLEARGVSTDRRNSVVDRHIP